MMRIGTKVKIVKTNGGDPIGWEGSRYEGKVGVVVDHDHDGDNVSRKDPLHIVRVQRRDSRGRFGHTEHDGFWTEELKRVRR